MAHSTGLGHTYTTLHTTHIASPRLAVHMCFCVFSHAAQLLEPHVLSSLLNAHCCAPLFSNKYFQRHLHCSRMIGVLFMKLLSPYGASSSVVGQKP
jgi:hypothetical protein